MKLVLLHATSVLREDWFRLAAGAISGFVSHGLPDGPWEIELDFDGGDDPDRLRRIELQSSGATVTVGHEEGLLIVGSFRTGNTCCRFRTALTPFSRPRALDLVWVPAVSKEANPFAAQIFCAN